MALKTKNVEKLPYRAIEVPKLTRGIVGDSSELIGSTPLARLSRVTEGARAEVVARKPENEGKLTWAEPGSWIEGVRVVMLWLMCCPQGLRQYQL